jgi:hypothetical protein
MSSAIHRQSMDEDPSRRLRRETLRIFARKIANRELSATEAEALLLVNHGNIESSLLTLERPTPRAVPAERYDGSAAIDYAATPQDNTGVSASAEAPDALALNANREPGPVVRLRRSVVVPRAADAARVVASFLLGFEVLRFLAEAARKHFSANASANTLIIVGVCCSITIVWCLRTLRRNNTNTPDQRSGIVVLFGIAIAEGIGIAVGAGLSALIGSLPALLTMMWYYRKSRPSAI